MALSLRRARARKPATPEPDRSVADVLHQLHALTGELRTQVDRLEHANDQAATDIKEGR